MVIRVLPPAMSFWGPNRGLTIAMVCISGLAVGGLLVAMSWSTDTPPLLVLWCVPVVLAAIPALVRRSQRYRRARAEFVRRVPPMKQCPAAAVLEERWKSLSLPPSVKKILSCCEWAAPAPPDGARIVCLGMIDLPDPGDLRFEPGIITPTRYLWWRLWPVPFGLAVLGAIVAQGLGVLPWSWLGFVSSFYYFIGLSVGAASVWFWRSTIRPTYVRYAPGIVQIVRFGFRGGRPTIRSYPMTAHTTAILVNNGTRPNRVTTLTLVRGDLRDVLLLWQVARHGQVLQGILQSLVSTAPTPPLSDEGLVG